MKPTTTSVMLNMIQQIKDAFPFDITEEELCAESCSYGCPQKLLEFMRLEIADWEQRLENGEIPNFRDIQKLEKTGRKIYRVLEKNHLLRPT
jgi:hypothetical protein